eukprot:TRINITY_DN11003_c0_g1_i1.p1 TRINITY_DN11003_c0_g1~~TRINITY_DN11003_c0_g1_i1.p1  ORF type:complete len:507 (-),score=134.24 TRINITY_DN11003_c0_g1_i1:51-1529(-)
MSINKIFCLLLVCLVFVSSCYADDTEEGGVESNVVVLTNANFDQVIQDNPFVLVEIYAPWCGHCRNLAPHYEEAANILKAQNSPIILAKLDGSQEEERPLVSKLQVRGFPTLIFYNNGVPTQYNGQRTAEEIVSWVVKKSGPSFVALSDVAAYDAYLESNPNVSIIGYFTNGSAEYEAYSRVASNPNYDSMSLAITTDADVAARAGLTLNQVGVRRDFDEPATFDVTSDSSALNTFLSRNVYPYLQPAYVSWGRLRELNVPIAIFIYDENNETSADQVKFVTDLAKSMSGEFGFATVGAEYLERSTQLGGTGKKLPTIIAVSPLQLNYPFPDESEFTKENVESWARGVLSGSVKPHFKSEPVPETQEGPVFKLVGSNFEEVVMKSGKTVFVEFYAPWCGHCKNLEPIWEQLAQHYQGNDGIVIAKIDSTQNDNPSVAVSGYPTIYLFVSGNAPVEYSGPRDLESLISFVDTNHGTAVAEDATVQEATAHEEL